MKIRAHKIRITGVTASQRNHCNKAFGIARQAYNYTIDKMLGFWISEIDSRKLYTQEKEFRPYVYDVSKCVSQEASIAAGKAVEEYWAKKKGRPGFRRKYKNMSFVIAGDHLTLSGTQLKIAKLSEPLRLTEELRFSGRIIDVTISLKAGNYYASIRVAVDDNCITRPKVENQDLIGVDVGISNLVQASSGEKVEALKPLRKSLKTLKRLGRKLSRQEKGKANWSKTVLKLQKLYERVTNVRLEVLHKITNWLSKYKYVGIEDLNISGMLKNHHLALAIADSCFYEFKRQLNYKCEETGSTVVMVDRYFPSTKLCNSCKGYNLVTLSDRTITCVHCGKTYNRDYNASLNIEEETLRLTRVSMPRVVPVCVSKKTTKTVDGYGAVGSSKVVSIKKELNILC